MSIISTQLEAKSFYPCSRKSYLNPYIHGHSQVHKNTTAVTNKHCQSIAPYQSLRILPYAYTEEIVV